MEVPGQVPQSPVMRVAPVLVRVEAAIAPKDAAAPMTTGTERLSREGRPRAEVLRARTLRLRILQCMMKVGEGTEVLVVVLEDLEKDA